MRDGDQDWADRAAAGIKRKAPWRWLIFPCPCEHSIVSAGAFHFRVRYGNGWCHPALITRERMESYQFRRRTARVNGEVDTELTAAGRRADQPFSKGDWPSNIE